jgi:outer membrane murein-binding lipoprotein Lpp
MITIISAILYATMLAGFCSAVVAYMYERRKREEMKATIEDYSAMVEQLQLELNSARMELSKNAGISIGRECDAMQRRFIESLEQHGQASVHLSARRANRA